MNIKSTFTFHFHPFISNFGFRSSGVVFPLKFHQLILGDPVDYSPHCQDQVGANPELLIFITYFLDLSKFFHFSGPLGFEEFVLQPLHLADLKRCNAYWVVHWPVNMHLPCSKEGCDGRRRETFYSDFSCNFFLFLLKFGSWIIFCLCFRYLLDQDGRHMEWMRTWRRGHDCFTWPQYSCRITKLWLAKVLRHIQHEAINQFVAVFSLCLGSEWPGILDQRKIYSIDGGGYLPSDGIVEAWCPSFTIRIHPWRWICERLHSSVL